MALIAHVGHDLVSLAFFVPTVAFLVWLAVTQLRQRRAERGRTEGGPLP
jgi:hypothetical protein